MKPSFPLAILTAFFCSLFFVTEINGVDVFNRNLVINDNYTVDWTVDLPKKNVTFTVVAKTKGWVGFGISPQGGMNNADVVIGGVQDKTVTYFTDRFATEKKEPKVDDEQNWHLISGSENDTHTTLKFWRNLNTCDDKEDLPITSDTTKFIWSYGETDKIDQHANRGTAAVGILDSEVIPTNTADFKTWNITVNTKIPTRDTAYWCTFHKRPSFRDGIKRHIVGFQVLLNNPESLEFNHHMLLHKCVKDPTVFSPDPEGGECYDEDGTGVMEAMVYCQSVLYVWGKGGLPLFLPEDVGIPLFEDENNPDEYYALEVHYDNPKVQANVQYETGIQVFYVDKLRAHDAGILVTGHQVEWSMVIPPESTDFVTVGHCSSNCTKQNVPPEGLNIFNVLLHSHLAGRKLKLRHFRGQEELPWIAYDDSYDFDYQQNKPLRNDVKFLPGDQLTYECTYATGSNVTIGGLTTRHEMCEAFIMYWPLMPKMDVCDSTYVYDNLLQSLNITAEDLALAENAREPTVVKYENKIWSDFLKNDVNWTDSFRTEFKRANRYDQHYEFCFSMDEFIPEERKSGRGSRKSVVPLADENEEEVVWPTVTYPKDLKEYVPLEDDECTGSSFTTTPQFFTLILFTSLSFLFSYL